MRTHGTSLLLFLLSLVCLSASFYFPFFSIQLDMEVPETVQYGKELIVAGTQMPLVGGSIQDMVSNFFGPELFSQQCLRNWTPCFQDWIATQIGITRGDQYLLRMIRDTFGHGEIFLGTIILVFSVLFPISKNVLGVLAGLSSSTTTKQGYYMLLDKTGKWSMTDVFVVALLILFFKAENIHLHLHSDIGVYCFAISTLLSSIAAKILGSELGVRIQFSTTSPADHSTSNPRNTSTTWDDSGF